MSRFRVTAAVAAALVAATVVGGASSHGFANGTPPPELGENAATGWPAHNFDLSNSRANLQTDINSTNVATLKQKWAFKLPYSGAFGAFTSNPIVLNSVVYFEDPDSNVYALDQATESSTGCTSTSRSRLPAARTASPSATACCLAQPRTSCSRS